MFATKLIEVIAHTSLAGLKSTLPLGSSFYAIPILSSLYRTCRQRGHTVRKLIDCLIAAVVIRADIPIIHMDADFDILAQHTALQVAVV